MSDNKTILITANKAVTAGDNEGFLSYCTDDLVWEFVGEQILSGKEAVRAYMKQNYVEPPQFVVEELIAEGEFVTAIGKISLKNAEGQLIHYKYCDVWKFRNGKMAVLKAFVIETGEK